MAREAPTAASVGVTVIRWEMTNVATVESPNESLPRMVWVPHCAGGMVKAMLTVPTEDDVVDSTVVPSK
jgi:hypothetical protein